MSQATRERQDRILAEVLNVRHVTVSQLAEHLDVSEATVRRDLRSLSEDRKVQLVHGGATLPRSTDFSFQAKGLRQTDAKRQIAALAADMIADGEQLFLDSGTTCFELCPHLRRKRGLSVIANSARIAIELNQPSLSMILLGGQYRADRQDTIGPIAVSTLQQLRGYLAFIGADGLSMDFGPSASDVDSAHLNRLAIQNAREVILLVDSSKFESPALFRIVEWEAIGRIITNHPPSPDWLDFLASHDIEVIWPDGRDQ